MHIFIFKVILNLVHRLINFQWLVLSYTNLQLILHTFLQISYTKILGEKRAAFLWVFIALAENGENLIITQSLMNAPLTKHPLLRSKSLVSTKGAWSIKYHMVSSCLQSADHDLRSPLNKLYKYILHSSSTLKRFEAMCNSHHLLALV